MKKNYSNKISVLKYDEKLDQEAKLKELAKKYDNEDSEILFDFQQAKKHKGEIKRVNMQIPFEIYLDAIKIAELSGTGYQNTLKIAITLGLQQLRTLSGIK